MSHPWFSRNLRTDSCFTFLKNFHKIFYSCFGSFKRKVWKIDSELVLPPCHRLVLYTLYNIIQEKKKYAKRKKSIKLLDKRICRTKFLIMTLHMIYNRQYTLPCISACPWKFSFIFRRDLWVTVKHISRQKG